MEREMMVTNRYANAFSEVYEILSYLDEKDYEKIPENFLRVIEENRNLDYEYELNEKLELKNQEMLPETKAILFNIFRDYLSTSEQSQKIKKWQAEDIKKLEEQKHEKYSVDVFEKEEKKECLEIIDEKDNIFKKIKRFLGKIRRKFKWWN